MWVLSLHLEGEGNQCLPCGKTRSDVVVVRIRNQGQVARALDGGGELALVARLGAADAARDALAVLGQVLAQGVEILVVDLIDTLGGDLAVLAAGKELGHVCHTQADSAVSSSAGSASLL